MARGFELHDPAPFLEPIGSLGVYDTDASPLMLMHLMLVLEQEVTLRRGVFFTALRCLVAMLVPLVAAMLWVRSYYVHDQILRGWTTATLVPHPSMPAKQAVKCEEGNLGLESNIGSIGIFWGTYPSIYNEGDKSPRPFNAFWRMRALVPGKTYEHFTPGALGFHVCWQSFPLGSPEAETLDDDPPALSYGMYRREFLIPYWPFVCAGVVLLALGVRRSVQQRRQFLVGHCRKCGYDLRASKDRCPECGTALSTSFNDSINSLPSDPSP